MKMLLSLSFALVTAIVGGCGSATPPIRITVNDRVLNEVDARLFGQFMEIASWGEPGPEALVDPETGELPAAVVERLKWMRPPSIRYPGGSDVGRIDWTDRIDHAPGRDAARPITDYGKGRKLSNHFGYDEFLRLCEQLGSEPLLVVNFRHAAIGEKTVEQAATRAAALVAYCNAKVGQANQPAGIDWAAIRARNGRDRPWAVKHWQIGNELFMYLRKDEAALARAEQAGVSPAQWSADAIAAFAKAMLAVDPTIELFVEGSVGDPEWSKHILSDPRIANLAQFATRHHYQPGGLKKLERGGQEIEMKDLSDDQRWYAWTSMPSRYDEQGRTHALTDKGMPPGWAGKVGVTEWNWNGWGKGLDQHKAETALGAGLGAAGYLHGLIREGDRIKIANQSMLVGVSWGIAAIKAHREAEHAPYLQPTGLATGFYRRHHGDRRLAITVEGDVPAFTQDLTFHGWGRTRVQSPLPMLDVVATRSDRALFLHAINRSRSAALSVTLEVEAVGQATGPIVVRRMVPKPAEHRVAERDAATIVESTLRPAALRRPLDLPAQSVTIFKIPLSRP